MKRTHLHIQVFYFEHQVFQFEHIKELTPPGFKLLCQDRPVVNSVIRGGGGVCLMDERFESTPIQSQLYPSFEHLISSDFDKVNST